MRYYGFVYLWFDTVRRKFCVGSHFGSLDDGYLTSTGHMKLAYMKRPETFKRRILEYCYEDNLQALQSKEQHWLDLIKDEELGIKYYNLKKIATGGNGQANKGNSNIGGWNRGVTREMLKLRKCGDFCLLIDKPKDQIYQLEWTPERREKASTNMKKKWENGILHPSESWNKGETKETNQSVKRMSEAKKGKPTWNKGKSCPNAAENGKKSADKISKTVTGRKRHQRPDGSITWKYPVGDGRWYTKENGEQVPVS